MLASLVAFAVPAAAQRAPEPEPAWRTSAMALVPAGYVAGDAYRTDETAMTGYLAIYPAGGDDPKSPASVFAPRLALIVRLARENGALRAVAAETKPREDTARGNRDTAMTDPDGNEDDVARRHADLAASRDRLPPGTEPCDLGAWSADRDPRGLNVRAAPSASSKVLGTLPPPFKFKAKGRENTPEGGWLTEFRIIGFKDGWFLIEGATPLPNFTHPKRALYLFGPEDGTLGRKHTDRAQHVVYVPTRCCMNLAATVNVVLYDRQMKRAIGPGMSMVAA